MTLSNWLHTERLREALDVFAKAFLACKGKKTKIRVDTMFYPVQHFKEAILADCHALDPLRISFCKFADHFLRSRKLAVAEGYLNHLGSNVYVWIQRHHNFVRKACGKPPIKFPPLVQKPQKRTGRGAAPARKAPARAQHSQRSGPRQPARSQQPRSRSAQCPPQRICIAKRKPHCPHCKKDLLLLSRQQDLILSSTAYRAGYNCEICKRRSPTWPVSHCRTCLFDVCLFCAPRPDAWN